MAAGAKVILQLKATIDEGWHLYSPTTPPGPIPTEIKLEASPAVASYKVYQPEPKRVFDPNFKQESFSFEKEVVFLIEATLSSTLPDTLDFTAASRYQVCSDTLCLRPVRRNSTVSLNSKTPAAGAAVRSVPAGYTLVPAAGEVSSSTPVPTPAPGT
ncbi:MAG: protein-disulfide reductase DsbD N-terminal domain-containing protein, partial [Acidobacteriota bacterium]